MQIWDHFVQKEADSAQSYDGFFIAPGKSFQVLILRFNGHWDDGMKRQTII